MFWMLLASALAGPPYHACAADKDGTVAVLSPGNRTVAVLRHRELHPIATLDQSGVVHWPHVIYAHPEGGWWVKAHDTVRVEVDGTVTAMTQRAPEKMWAALQNRQIATHRGDDVYVFTYDSAEVVLESKAGKRTVLWKVTERSRTPKGLSIVGDTLHSLVAFSVEQHTLDGTLRSEIPAPPKREIIGICGTPDGPLYAAVFAEKDKVCLLRRDGQAWVDVDCIEP